jgi:hypothetical protein
MRPTDTVEVGRSRRRRQNVANDQPFDEWLDSLSDEQRQRLYWALTLERGLQQMDQVDLGRELAWPK